MLSLHGSSFAVVQALRVRLFTQTYVSATTPRTVGWMSFYWGTAAQLDMSPIGAAMYDHLRLWWRQWCRLRWRWSWLHWQWWWQWCISVYFASTAALTASADASAAATYANDFNLSYIRSWSEPIVRAHCSRRRQGTTTGSEYLKAADHGSKMRLCGLIVIYERVMWHVLLLNVRVLFRQHPCSNRPHICGLALELAPGTAALTSKLAVGKAEVAGATLV